MTELGLENTAGRRSPWADLLEQRFTNADLVVVLAALVLTGLIGALTGVSLML